MESDIHPGHYCTFLEMCEKPPTNLPEGDEGIPSGSVETAAPFGFRRGQRCSGTSPFSINVRQNSSDQEITSAGSRSRMVSLRRKENVGCSFHPLTSRRSTGD